MLVKGSLTPKSNFLPVHCRLPANYVRANFRTQYFIVIDKIIIKYTMMMGNSCAQEDRKPLHLHLKFTYRFQVIIWCNGSSTNLNSVQSSRNVPYCHSKCHPLAGEILLSHDRHSGRPSLFNKTLPVAVQQLNAISFRRCFSLSHCFCFNLTA